MFSDISRLTLHTRGVESHSFFDNFDVFPVGAESGAQAVVTAQQSASDESREADGTAVDEVRDGELHDTATVNR